MNMAMILGLFPGFMSMVAVYFILKAIGLTEGNLINVALILCYSGGAGLGFQIAKGFFDTIPIAIGLWKMLEKEYIDSWYTSFAAGAVLISIPIAILFLFMQRYYVDGVSGAVKG